MNIGSKLSDLVQPQDFVLIWERSESVEEVAEATGMNPNAVRTRAYFYRKKGVNLKVFEPKPRGKAPLPVDELNMLINRNGKSKGKRE
jgi:hypothetical protein